MTMIAQKVIVLHPYWDDKQFVTCCYFLFISVSAVYPLLRTARSGKIRNNLRSSATPLFFQKDLYHM